MFTPVRDLDSAQCNFLTSELSKLDNKVGAKALHVQFKVGLTQAEALEYVINDSPMLWAKTYLNWEARDYQKDILNQGKKAKKLVLRLGRRLGKTEDMCILILWHCFARPNMGKNQTVYDVLILTPFETQVDLIFKRLNQLIDQSQLLMQELDNRIQHKIKFKGEVTITGLTLGVKSGSQGANTRGQRADLIIYDEVDYADSPTITNTMNIRNEAPDRIKVIAASTPCGKREEFYKWCTEATTRIMAKEEDINSFKFTGYETIYNADGNGWTNKKAS